MLATPLSRFDRRLKKRFPWVFNRLFASRADSGAAGNRPGRFGAVFQNRLPSVTLKPTSGAVSLRPMRAERLPFQPPFPCQP